MLIERVNCAVKARPGMTAREIAEFLFGIDGYGGRVGCACTDLAGAGRVIREGSGGPGDPYTYRPIVA
jgi:hypothetical protein